MSNTSEPVGHLLHSGTPTDEQRLIIDVLYGAEGLGVTRKVSIPQGATNSEAIAASGLMADYPELREGTLVLSAYGRRIKNDALGLDGQRIEILRPLQVSPKEARRQLAAQRIKTPAPQQPARGKRRQRPH